MHTHEHPPWFLTLVFHHHRVLLNVLGHHRKTKQKKRRCKGKPGLRARNPRNDSTTAKVKHHRCHLKYSNSLQTKAKHSATLAFYFSYSNSPTWRNTKRTKLHRWFG
ncbi:unnamed protein product [Ectocarpus sp. 12 AP-2014]